MRALWRSGLRRERIRTQISRVGQKPRPHYVDAVSVALFSFHQRTASCSVSEAQILHADQSGSTAVLTRFDFCNFAQSLVERLHRILKFLWRVSNHLRNSRVVILALRGFVQRKKLPKDGAQRDFVLHASC
jgi:hypothetical protein